MTKEQRTIQIMGGEEGDVVEYTRQTGECWMTRLARSQRSHPHTYVARGVERCVYILNVMSNGRVH